MTLISTQSVSLEKKDNPVVSLTKRDILPVAMVLGGEAGVVFSTTQWQSITSQTWEAVTQTWD